MFGRALTAFILVLSVLMTTGAAQTTPGLLTAKKDAEARGYIFAGSHEEIIKSSQKGRQIKRRRLAIAGHFEPNECGVQEKISFH
jgi:hypothetical protein